MLTRRVATAVARGVRTVSTDFGKTASDYARHRQGFPKEFFERLKLHALVKPGLKALDIGTGTGTVARGLALEGCNVVGIDIAEPLLEEARKLDQEVGVEVDYRVGSAEKTGCEDSQFDLVVAGQCWHWFNHEAAIHEIERVLKPEGKLIIAHFDWLPTRGTVPELTEDLILKYNPRWHLGGGTGFYPQWAVQLAEADFSGIETYTFDEGIIYTHEQWRGRIRASAGIGASLPLEEVEAFDKEHTEELKRRFPEDPLKITHRVFTLFATRPSTEKHSKRQREVGTDEIPRAKL